VTDDAVHKLGEVLRTAREAKGVDLVRVERDTKIRSRYLAALEGGAYRDLPGAVYTKGFLRNYGLYLGLDPEYLIDLYRLETSQQVASRPTVGAPPRPIEMRRRRSFVVTPGVVVAAMLTVLVLVVFAYIGGQLLVFAGTPDLQITDPPGPLSAYDGTTYTLHGRTAANAQVTVGGLTENPRTTADALGNFEVTIGLKPGRNVVELTALDPKTGRTSASVSREITVVLGGPSPSTEPSAVTVTAPADATTAAGPLALAGSAAPGAVVTVTASPTAAPPLTFAIVTASGAAVPVSATLPTAPAPTSLTADATGAFSGTMSLPAGSWTIAFTSGNATDSTATRNVIVTPAGGLTATLAIAGAQSYLEADEDGRPKAGISGGISDPGDSVTLVAQRDLRIRAGNAGAVTVTINGIRIGPMGGSGDVVEWRVTRR
jgi:cytoskeletal protein RodZ